MSSELEPCPFTPAEIADTIEKLIPEIECNMTLYAYERSALHGAVSVLRRVQPANDSLVRCGEYAKYQSPQCALVNETGEHQE